MILMQSIKVESCGDRGNTPQQSEACTNRQLEKEKPLKMNEWRDVGTKIRVNCAFYNKQICLIAKRDLCSRQEDAPIAW